MDEPRDKVLGNALTVAAALFLLLTTSLRAFKSGILEGFEANLMFAVLILAGLCLHVMGSLLLHRHTYVRTRTEWAAVAFAVLCIVSVFVAGEKRAAFGVAANWMAYLVLFYLVVCVAQRDQMWRVVFAVALATATVVCVYGAYQYHVEWGRTLADFREVKERYGNDPKAMARHFGKSDIRVGPEGIADFEGRLKARRAIGTFVLPNSFAGYLILLIPAVMGCLADLVSFRWGNKTKPSSGARAARPAQSNGHSRKCAGRVAPTRPTAPAELASAPDEPQRELLRHGLTGRIAAAIAANAAAAILLLLLLFWTRSKGAWICLAAVAVGWLVVRWRARWWRYASGCMGMRLWDGLSRARLSRTTEDRRLETPSHGASKPDDQFSYRGYAKGIAVALLLLGVLFGALHDKWTLPEAGEYLGSFMVRTHYWRGGAKIVAERPWLGVGLGGFGVHYGRHIRPEDDESIRAHNNYLQIWCEMGIFGLAAFLAFWVMFWRRVSERAPEDLAAPALGEREKVLAALCGVVGPVAILLEPHLFSGVLDLSASGWPPFASQALVAVLWVAYYGATVSAAPALGLGLRTGLLVGLGCFLLHCLIDIDLYVPSLTQTAWTVAGVAVAASMATARGDAQGPAITLKPRVHLALGAGLVLATVAISLGLMPRVRDAKLHREQALAHERGGRLDLAVEEWSMVSTYDPWDPKAAIHRARGCWTLAIKAKDTRRKLQYLGQSAAAVTDAIRLSPASAACRAQLGEVLEETARTLVKLPKRREHAFHGLRLSLQHYQAAIELYPSKPKYHLRAARVLDALKKHEEAIVAYRRAIDLSARQRLPRNELGEAEVKLALARIDGLSRESPGDGKAGKVEKE